MIASSTFIISLLLPEHDGHVLELSAEEEHFVSIIDVIHLHKKMDKATAIIIDAKTNRVVVSLLVMDTEKEVRAKKRFHWGFQKVKRCDDDDYPVNPRSFI